MADRRVGDDRNRRLQRALRVEKDSARGTSRDLAVEDEGEARQAALAGDRVDRAGERLVEQRGRRRRGADRLPAGAFRAAKFGLGAEVAEMALVDREGLRQGHRERFDVGVAGPGLEVEAKRSGSCDRRCVLAAQLADRQLRFEREGRAVDRLEVGAEVGDRALVADALRVDASSAQQLVGLIMKFGLSMLTWIERIRIGMPPMIDGTVSETAMTWASSGSTWIATRTTTTP